MNQKKTSKNRHSVNAKDWMKPYILAVILGVLIILAYGHTLHYPFQFDDIPYIVQNEAIKDVGNIKAIWKALNHPSRFMAFYSFAINHHFNDLKPWGYRLVNIMIHMANTALVAWMMSLIFATPYMIKQKITQQKRVFIFCLCLWFGLHPIQTQAVTYVVQRFTSLAVLFYFLTVGSYLKARLLSLKNQPIAVFVVLAIVSGLCGMFTKPIVFTLPFALLLMEYCFFYSSDGKKKKNYKPFLHVIAGPILLSTLIVPALFSFKVKDIFGVRVPSGSHVGDIVTAPTYMLTQPRVIMTYIKLLVWPQGQSLDHDFALSQTLWDGPTFFSFLFLTFLFLCGVKWFNKNRLMAFGIFWFFLALSVESSIIPIHHVIYEHRVYLPSFGLFLAVLSFFYSHRKGQRIVVSFCVGVALIWGFLTYQRNKVWQSPMALWADVVANAPDQFKGYDNLGYAYYLNGDYDQSIVYYNKAIEVDPRYPGVFNNRGNSYSAKGDYQRALYDYQLALDRNPHYVEAYYNRGKAYQELKNYPLALENYTQAIHLNPRHASAYNNRGNVYGLMQQYQKALHDFNQALAIEKKDSTYYHRAFTYNKLGQFDLALKDYTEAINLNPEYVEAYNNRGNIYFRFKQYNLAIHEYDKALKVDPHFKNAYFNRGLSYAGMGRLQKALDDFTEVIAIDDRYAQAYHQRALIYQKQGLINKAQLDQQRAKQLGYSTNRKGDK